MKEVQRTLPDRTPASAASLHKSPIDKIYDDMIPGYTKEREERENAYQHIYKRQVADAAKSELQNTALVLMQLKS